MTRNRQKWKTKKHQMYSVMECQKLEVWNMEQLQRFPYIPALIIAYYITDALI